MQYQLRTWQLSDVYSLAKHANNWNIARFLTDAFPHPYSETNAKEFIQKVMEDSPTKIFAIDIDGESVGSIGLFPQNDVHCMNAELGYFLAEPFWGNGIMTAAIKDMVVYGFETFAVTRIYARPFGSNHASQRVLEKAGFTLEARLQRTLIKNGAFDDELIYAIRK